MFGFASQQSLQTEARDALLEFARICPPPDKASRPKSVPQNKVAAALHALHNRIAHFAQTQRLSFIGRARLAKALQSEMNRMGFPAGMVSQVISAVTMNALVTPGRHA